MRLLPVAALVLLTAGLLCSCPVDPKLSSRERMEVGPREFIRSFGGQGMEVGHFLSISGIAAADGVVEVADAGLARVQLFDYEGNFMRAIGSGIKLEGLLPNLNELYSRLSETEEELYPEAVVQAMREHTFFRALDVGFYDGELFVLNSLYSRLDRERAILKPAALRFDLEGNFLGEVSLPSVQVSFFAVDPAAHRLAVNDDLSNSLILVDVPTERTVFYAGVQDHTDMRGLIYQLQRVDDPERQSRIYRDWTHAGSGQDRFDSICGVAIYRDKVLAVDRNNRRVKIYSERGDLLGIVNDREPGRPRIFAEPLDVEVSPEGVVFLSDSSELVHGVLVLSPELKPRYAITHPDISIPGYLALSPEGYLFLTDVGTQKVYVFRPREYERRPATGGPTGAAIAGGLQANAGVRVP